MYAEKNYWWVCGVCGKDYGTEEEAEECCSQDEDDRTFSNEEE